MANKNWQPTIIDKKWHAPEGIVLWTKVDDERGVRHVQRLMRCGNLWCPQRIWQERHEGGARATQGDAVLQMPCRR